MPEFRALLAGGGEMGERIRAFDWAATPLGEPRGWPQSLRSALSICLNCSFPKAIYWGPELRLLYNDAWAPIPGARHPEALGRPAREVWTDIWHVIEPQFRAVLTTGRGFSTRDELLPMRRFGLTEETYWDYSFTPIAGEDGSVAGILNQGQETTDRVWAERRSALLLALNDRLRAISGPGEIIATALAMIGEQLDAGRAGYGVVNADRSEIHIERCWTRGAMPDIAGLRPLGTLGAELRETLAVGEIFHVEDALTDPRMQSPAIATLYKSIGLRSGVIAPVLKGGHYAAALFVHDDRPRRWSKHHHRLIRDVAERIWEELARTRAEMTLRDSEERHRLIFEQAQDIIFTANLDQRVTACNPAAGVAFGCAPEKLVGRSISEFVAPETFVQTTAMLNHKLIHGGTTRHDVDVIVGERVLKWEINSALSTDRDGHTTGLHVIARDVTARRAFEDRQQLLINELNHRVKNTLALVQALALQSFANGKDPAEAQAAFQDRLAALAAAHDMLTRAKWEGATLADLIGDATRQLANQSSRISFAGPPLIVAPKAAISLVLALRELGANAAKYGALSNGEGRVMIGWDGASDGRLRIEWRESGGPTPRAPTCNGFGLRLIQRALASDLDGVVNVSFAPEGFACTIDAPIAEITRGVPLP